jgi:hypothetical protein
MSTIRRQIHDNAVALISLFIAVSSLAYNTWRNETTEEQRNIRHASFLVLERLGELQQAVDYRHYYLPYRDNDVLESRSRLEGFGSAAMIHDLMSLMPRPAPSAGKQLHALWLGRFDDLGALDGQSRHTADAAAAEQELTSAIRESRSAVLRVLERLE